MARIPKKCPRCGKPKDGIETGKARKGFSFFKAIIGAIIFGPIGLFAGLLGKKRRLFICKNCGFSKGY